MAHSALLRRLALAATMVTSAPGLSGGGRGGGGRAVVGADSELRAGTSPADLSQTIPYFDQVRRPALATRCPAQSAPSPPFCSRTSPRHPLFPPRPRLRLQVYTVIEAENFSVSGSAWEPRAWAHSPGYFASNSANDFISRRAYLHADAHAANGTTATATVRIAQDGDYTVMVRYEALYRFETPFLVTVSQAGKVALERVYGYREGLKVWGYPYGGHPGTCPDLQAECLWPWGSTDNTVWEGYGVGATAKLTAGTATITLALMDGVPAGVDRASAHFADRNIDAVMLNANTTDLKMRLTYETGEVPFDGLLPLGGGAVRADLDDGAGRDNWG